MVATFVYGSSNVAKFNEIILWDQQNNYLSIQQNNYLSIQRINYLYTQQNNYYLSNEFFIYSTK